MISHAVICYTLFEILKNQKSILTIASSVMMSQKLEKTGHKAYSQPAGTFGNVCLLAFYSVVAGWVKPIFRYVSHSYISTAL